MQSNFACCTLVLFFLLGAPLGVAQQPAAGEASSQELQAAFDQAVNEYKEAIREIESRRAEYQSADADTREAMNAELADLIESTRKKVEQMTTAALELYQVAPNENEQVTELLLAMARHWSLGEAPPQATGGAYFGGDQYERALPVIQALIEGQHPEPQLYVWGGMSAVCTSQFDLAEQYLTAARQAGLFDGLPEFPVPNMPADQEFTLKARNYLADLDQLRTWWEEEKAIREAEAEADDLPRVKFTTTKGDIVLELFENEAPIATANMITLVKDDFYTDVVFHRVLPHFMAQGGDPTGKGSGGPGYSIACECYEPDARRHFRGTISMAHAGRDTGGSQFFLCFTPTDFLNGRHTAFGRVIEGIEVLGELQRINPQAEGPYPTPDKIISAEVLRDRGHDYDFEKLPER